LRNDEEDGKNGEVHLGGTAADGEDKSSDQEEEKTSE